MARTRSPFFSSGGEETRGCGACWKSPPSFTLSLSRSLSLPYSLPFRGFYGPWFRSLLCTGALLPSCSNPADSLQLGAVRQDANPSIDVRAHSRRGRHVVHRTEVWLSNRGADHTWSWESLPSIDGERESPKVFVFSPIYFRMYFRFVNQRGIVLWLCKLNDSCESLLVASERKWRVKSLQLNWVRKCWIFETFSCRENIVNVNCVLCALTIQHKTYWFWQPCIDIKAASIASIIRLRRALDRYLITNWLKVHCVFNINDLVIVLVSEIEFEIGTWIMIWSYMQHAVHQCFKEEQKCINR